VGVGTVISDNPQLNVRLVKGRNPRRIVLDSGLRIPLQSNLLTDREREKTIVVSTFGASREKALKIKATGATVWQVRADTAGRIALTRLWAKLGKMGIGSVLVEGGSQVFSDLLRRKLADQLLVFVAPKILGGGLNALNDLGIKSLQSSILFDGFKSRRVGGDLLFSGTILK
jgi:riboflavin-specific deaminase-like protein